MKDSNQNTTYRILVIDDNPEIHSDFRKILCSDRASSSELEATEALVFGEQSELGKQSLFEIKSAHQGQEGLAYVHHALQHDEQFALAFVDVRMPPGWDGIEVAPRLWMADPDLQIVICTAYSDYSWEEMFARIGASDRLVILKKPFDRMEVLQLAHTLTEKWRLIQQHRRELKDMEKAALARTRELEKTSEKLLAEIAKLKGLHDPPGPII